MTYAILIFSALVLEGFPEGTIYKGKYKGYGYRIFGFFRINYHLFLFLRWLGACIAVTAIFEGTDPITLVKGASLFFAYAVVEDWGYWLRTWEWPAKDEWISRMLGTTFGVPNVWPVGLAISYAMNWILN